MNLPDAKVSQVCSNCMKAQRHHCLWLFSCSLGPQEEAVAEMYCSALSFLQPKEGKGVFQIAGDDGGARLSFIRGGGILKVSWP